MSVDQPSNLAASVRQRLLNIAKRDGEAFDLVLTRYPSMCGSQRTSMLEKLTSFHKAI